ncbi:hypothetical protein GCM10014719_64960 [Planomonospora parontospora subsp. antibiotica]|uniref:hypothetical protein n=1 Tax=Planomonospora parontospora TaxID=58119 RepID=UPI00166FAAB8|nr:hypothetical protein [Planomonospora parontospora]GGL54668.1 hypothetical protein GCM10014719_64960 [Planomonospora parontospora subsp. antibiotica]GII19761.1 hypothetical protein Ppa05_64870 [Planomonospora parontospora subsp. antibiotica]
MNLFHDLVDDAGLFPPTALPMDEALARHRADLERRSPVLTHRFLCPASRLPVLRVHLEETPLPLRLGLILDTEEPPRLDGLEVELVEVPGARFETSAGRIELPDGRLPLEAVGSAARRFVEVTPAQLPVHLPDGVGLKVRCGGREPEDFPSAHDLGAFIAHCVRSGTPFKATAGLHHAVRHFDPALGTDRHGFVNLVLAVCAAVEGRDPVPVLKLTDVGELVRQARAVPDDAARRARELLVSYGSCNTATPIEDLLALDLIEPEPKPEPGTGTGTGTGTRPAKENA